MGLRRAAYDQQYFHTDPKAAKSSFFWRRSPPVVWLTAALTMRMLVEAARRWPRERSAPRGASRGRAGAPWRQAARRERRGDEDHGVGVRPERGSVIWKTTTTTIEGTRSCRTLATRGCSPSRVRTQGGPAVHSLFGDGLVGIEIERALKRFLRLLAVAAAS